MKVCSKCKLNKEKSDFKIDKRVKSGLSAACKKCLYSYRADNYDKWRKTEKNREMKKYGITLEIFNKMLKEQDGKCAICLEDNSKQNRSLHVDHNHKTGEVRQLLCSNCNTALGKIEPRPELLDAFKEYLIRHGSRG